MNHFDRENEGEIIENPTFVCDMCGLANVVLMDVSGDFGAARCTNCGVGYVDTRGEQ